MMMSWLDDPLALSLESVALYSTKYDVDTQCFRHDTHAKFMVCLRQARHEIEMLYTPIQNPGVWFLLTSPP